MPPDGPDPSLNDAKVIAQAEISQESESQDAEKESRELYRGLGIVEGRMEGFATKEDLQELQKRALLVLVSLLAGVIGISVGANMALARAILSLLIEILVPSSQLPPIAR